MELDLMPNLQLGGEVLIEDSEGNSELVNVSWNY